MGLRMGQLQSPLRVQAGIKSITGGRERNAHESQRRARSSNLWAPMGWLSHTKRVWQPWRGGAVGYRPSQKL